MLLDIGVGILFALGLAPLLHVEHTFMWILAGVVFALLPDVDALVNLVAHRGLGHEHKHRDLCHLPLLYIPIGVLILFPISYALTTLFVLCSLAHFLHDSIGIGWGVQWLSPINTDHFSFLYLYQPPGKPALPRKWFYRFAHADIDRLDRQYGDHDWIRHIYIELHPYAIVEALVFLVALGALYIVLF